MVRRWKTGIKGLDELLSGGIPESSLIGLVGSPGTGKTTFVMQMTYNALKEDMPVIYVVTGYPIDEFKGRMKEEGYLLKSFKKNICFIDAFSWRLPNARKDEHTLSSLTALNDLNAMIKNAIVDLQMDTSPGLIAIDSLSDFLLYNDPTSVYKFLQLLSGLVKAYTSVGIVVIEQGLHDEQVLKTIEYITDGTLELKMFGDKRMGRIKRMKDTAHPLDWVEFELGKEIIIKVNGDLLFKHGMIKKPR
ncbi:MAG: AAA family ATPase [Candidatus Diapherotrites archaeon]|nr:AAA family ATPase [Candidatus Diapherotrites archaeon]